MISELICVATKEVIGFSGNTTTTVPYREAIKDLIHLVDQHPQLEIPVTHYFSPGIYAREITMPAGMTGVGHIHKHRHLNIALTGKAIVSCDGISQAVQAPFIFESMPGAQKAFQVIEDLRWITIHANPKDISDVVEMEREIFELPQEQIDSGLEVDAYRMKKQPSIQSPPEGYANINGTMVHLESAFSELTEELNRAENITGADLSTRICQD